MKIPISLELARKIEALPPDHQEWVIKDALKKCVQRMVFGEPGLEPVGLLESPHLDDKPQPAIQNRNPTRRPFSQNYLNLKPKNKAPYRNR
ncbi:MAG: hypothetical protein OEZ68_15735 [Gammaproteobacteria bacterium]|nr:hypothetical protein [Gammaproteobacteria bacterium]MDH5802252.1 hypothetical protein [Gammaproteobacteria bacterium]